MLRRVGKLTARAFAAVMSGLLTVTALAQLPREEPADDGFSAEERQRLANGELVTRRTTRRRGQLRLIGGSAFQVVERPVEDTWRALHDHGAYDRMLPSTEEARLVVRREDQRVMRIRHRVGFVSAQYHLHLAFDEARRDVAFRLDRQRPSDLRAAWGFIRVQPYEDAADRTLVSYGAMVDPGGGVLGGVLRGQIHDWVLRVPATIRAYLQGDGANLYSAP